MCEEASPLSYSPGDVVWVKLGPCWWPGEVVSFEELPSDITESFKKAPLAAVKFFDEEKYEFIRQLTHIHPYDSDKKYEFIKKGLDLHRAKNAFMDKFPKDVCTAETKTNGDPNILNDSRVGPEKKLNYSAIFGSPISKKKGSKESPNRNRGRHSTGRHSLPNSTKQKDRYITHPRFLGKDDSEIRILVQTPLSTTATPPESEYKCYTCGFQTPRVDVIFLHNKYHLNTSCNSAHTSPKKTKKSPSKRPKKRLRMPTSKTTSIDEDLALLRQGLPVCSDHTTSEESSSESEDEPVIKRKAKVKSPPKPKKIKTPPAPEVKKQTDIRTDLLAEWDDDEDDEEPPTAERISPKPTVSAVESKSAPEPPKSDEKEKSCFDFVEDEEDLLTALEGRKIPRVIPPTDKRKSIQDCEDEAMIVVNEEISVTTSRSPSPKNNEDSIIESESEKAKDGNDLEIHCQIEENDAATRKSQFQLEFEAFNALREISVPEMIDSPPLTKYEQNFHDVKTIKFPDKTDEEPNDSKVASSPTPTNNENAKTEEAKQLETIKIEPVVEPVPEPTKEPVVRKTEVATKLTNPKKRFVKTFEDETKNSTREENAILEMKKEPSPEPVKKELKSLEVSKLKTQLMKKLVDSSPKKESIRRSEKSNTATYKSNKRIEKITPVKSKVSKRNKDTKSENQSGTYAKKKRYFIEESDGQNDYSQSKSEVMNVQKAVSENLRDRVPEDRIISECETNNFNQLEYLNTSPTKIFRELNVDKDEYPAGNLSESQKLTIQNIIGVSSPKLTPQQSSSDQSSFREEKIPVVVISQESVAEIKDRVEERLLEDVEIESQEKNQVEAIKIDVESVEDEEMNKLVSEEPGETQKETSESNVDHITTTSTALYQIDEKLSPRISEKLPDEIIERCQSKIVEDFQVKEETPENVDENLKDDILVRTSADVIEKPLEKDEVVTKEDEIRMQDEIKQMEEIKQLEEEVGMLLEKQRAVSNIQELSEQTIPEEKMEVSKQENSEKDIIEDVDVEKVEEFEGKSEHVLIETKELPELQIQEKVDVSPEKLEVLSEEKIENETSNKSEESKEDLLEKLPENKISTKEDLIPSLDLDERLMTGTSPKVTETEVNVEECKNNINNAPNNLTIDKENETSVQADKEDSVLSNENNKTDFHLPAGSLGKNTSDLVKSMFDEEEMVNIEGNLTVVTETDLADKQVEIATTPEVSKPITLSTFSMDFCDDVESYVKGETIMQDFPTTKSSSLTDDVAKDVTAQENTAEIKITVEPEDENMESCRNETINESNQMKKGDSVDIVLEAIKSEEKPENEGSELKKFENVVTPAKDVPPAVIMEEGYGESVKEEIPEAILSIHEEGVKVHVGMEDIYKANLAMDVPAKTDSKEITDDIDSNKKDSTADNTVKEISQKEEIIIPPVDISVESEVAKITDSIVEREGAPEIVIKDIHRNTSSTKLLEILTDRPKSNHTKPAPTTPPAPKIDESSTAPSKITQKHPKFVTKQAATPGPSKSTKATILSDKLIKPIDESKTVSVKKVTSKRSYQDVEDIDTYIIQKPVKKLNVSAESDTKMAKKSSPVISKGKARILQQTIITPTGDILQPPVSQSQTDDNMFDINSMPIVLSDQILTPESIENMQIVLQENTATTKPQATPVKKQTQGQQQVKLLNKTQSPAGASMKETILKSPVQKQIQINKQKMQKVYPSTPKIIKHNPSIITQPGKQGKFIIVPATTTATGTKYTVGKRAAIIKKPPQKVVTPVSKTPDVPMTAAGNKIMILKGQQQKILLSTPHKQLPQTKVKGRSVHKQIITKDSPQQKGANIISQTILNSKGQITSTLPNQSPMSSRSQIIASISQQNRNIKIDPAKMKRAQQQRIALQNEISKPSTSGQQRTIIIKNPQGQTVKKIQGSDDALLDQQVAEQLQAISRASANQHLKDLSPRTALKLPSKKPYLKKQEIKVPKNLIQSTQTSNKNVSVPPLAPISPAKKVEKHYKDANSELSIGVDKSDEPKRQPHQLVIQDAQGNQTTITEGQILALPSEAIEGQPHSYVLVTLDETGNLTPLNSEALMSLDPNLNLTSDLGNMVLQIDQGVTPEPESPVPETPQRVVAEHIETTNPQNVLVKEPVDKTPVENALLTETPAATETSDQNVQAVINSGEMGQLIITGDAAAAQKFLESLAEGNADLANLLANAEGNVLIQAEGQQILINTDTENPMLVMNPENISGETNESTGNPVFASQPVKNQDILAAALADTDVFQQDQSISHTPSKIVTQSQLSPNNPLYPMNVGNVLETNSMSSPIMTPLEVPSTNSKKIDNENEILTQVPKNVDLPITITDPNISQTVAQQQVAALMATELPTNLDLPLAIQDPGLSVTSTEMNSPSFVYSLPTLDDTVDINQKAFSGSISMPLLTEEPEDPIAESSNGGAKKASESKEKKDEDDTKNVELDEVKNSKEADVNKSDDKEIETDEKKTDFTEGLCAMRGGICNSLSEPPPDMFDFAMENQSYDTPQNSDMDVPMDSTRSSGLSNAINDRESSVSSMEERKTDDVALYTANTSPSTNTDDSCEIPVQPPIIAKPFEENGTTDSRFGEEEKSTTGGDV